LGNSNGNSGDGGDDLLAKLFDQLDEGASAASQEQSAADQSNDSKVKKSSPDLFGGATQVEGDLSAARRISQRQSLNQDDQPVLDRTQVLARSGSTDLFSEVLKEETQAESSFSLFEQVDRVETATEVPDSQLHLTLEDSVDHKTVILDEVAEAVEENPSKHAEDPIDAALQEFRLSSDVRKQGEKNERGESSLGSSKVKKPPSVSAADFQDVFSAKSIKVSQSQLAAQSTFRLSPAVKRAAAILLVAVPLISISAWTFFELQSDTGLAGYKMDGWSIVRAYVAPTETQLAQFEVTFQQSEEAMLGDEPDQLIKGVADLEAILAQDARNIEAASRILDHAARLSWWYGVGSAWSKKFDDTMVRLSSLLQTGTNSAASLVAERSRAQRLIAIGDFQSAKDGLQKALQKSNSVDVLSMAMLAEMDVEIGDLKSAATWLSKVETSDSPRVKLLSGLVRDSSEDIKALSQTGYMPAKVYAAIRSDSQTDSVERLKAVEALAKQVESFPALTQKLSVYQGDLYASLGEREKALSQWQKVVEVQPRSVSVLAKIGKLNVELQKWDDALSAYSAIAKTGTWTQDFVIEYAELMTKRGLISEASQFLAKAVERYPSVPSVLTQSARVQMELKQLEPAKVLFGKALAIEPKYEPAILGLVDIHIERKEWAEATLLLKNISPKSPAYSAALASLAKLALMNGDRDLAEDQFMEALRRDDKIEALYEPLTQLLLDKGDFDQAREIVELGLKTNPQSPQTQLAKAKYLIADRRFGDAMQIIEPLKKAHPHLASVMEYEAFVLISQGRGPEALSVINQLSRRASGSPEVTYLRLALFSSEAGKRVADISGTDQAMKEMSLLLRQRPEEERYRVLAAQISLTAQDRLAAQEHIDFALKRNPRSAVAWQIQGEIFMEQTRFDQASKAFQKALDLARFRSQLYNRLAESFKQQGNAAAAIQYYQKVIRERPRDAEAYLELGKLFNSDGRYQAAIDSLNKAVQLDSRLAEAYYFLGFVQKETGNQAGALQSFEKFLSLKPSAVEAATIQDEVFFLRKSTNSPN
jgi:tetratricopeptide (TPR) repeat protein